MNPALLPRNFFANPNYHATIIVIVIHIIVRITHVHSLFILADTNIHATMIILLWVCDCNDIEMLTTRKPLLEANLRIRPSIRKTVRERNGIMWGKFPNGGPPAMNDNGRG